MPTAKEEAQLGEEEEELEEEAVRECCDQCRIRISHTRIISLSSSSSSRVMWNCLLLCSKHSVF